MHALAQELRPAAVPASPVVTPARAAVEPARVEAPTEVEAQMQSHRKSGVTLTLVGVAFLLAVSVFAVVDAITRRDVPHPAMHPVVQSLHAAQVVLPSR